MWVARTEGDHFRQVEKEMTGELLAWRKREADMFSNKLPDDIGELVERFLRRKEQEGEAAHENNIVLFPVNPPCD